MNCRKIPANTRPDKSETKRARLLSENHWTEMYVTSTANATSRIWIVAERLKLNRARFSRISVRKGVDRAAGCSSASEARRRSPMSLNWPKAMSTVARNVSARSRRKLTANSISIKASKW